MPTLMNGVAGRSRRGAAGQRTC